MEDEHGNRKWKMENGRACFKLQYHLIFFLVARYFPQDYRFGDVSKKIIGDLFGKRKKKGD